LKYLDYAFAWTLFVVGMAMMVDIEIWHPPHAVLDTPLLWIFVAMFNLLRLRNGYSVPNLRVFCIGANVAALALEVVSLRMSGFSLGGLPFEVPILVETILSLRKQ
jgi:hypothetical protein